MSMLQVIVVGATNVPNVEKFGESDPYTTVEFKGELVANLLNFPSASNQNKYTCLPTYTYVKCRQCQKNEMSYKTTALICIVFVHLNCTF